MHLSVKGKQLDVGDALRTHVGDSLNAIVGKYFGRPIEANVVFSREAHLFKADISVHVGRNILLQSNAEASEPYPAFDTAEDKIAKRLRRYKRRLKDRRGNGKSHNVVGSIESAPTFVDTVLSAPDSDADDDENGNPAVIAEATSSLVRMSVRDAVLQLDLTGAPVFVFRHANHGRVNFVYRRADGHIGWIDPPSTA